MAGNKPLIVILGPTAVGKTALAIQLAQHINGEIVGADSRQVYRYMDIGTAKPTITERQQAKHHLIDFILPDNTLSLAEYQDLAYAAIDAIHQCNKYPLLVGGTGQYITAVVEGWSIPRVPPNNVLRGELETKAVQHGPAILHQQLADVDPEAASKIHPNNVRRIIRALEVYIETGTPISELQRKTPPPYDIITYGLNLDREKLYERADQRVDQMLERGFVDEVKQLLDMGYDHSVPSMSGLGYSEIASAVLGDIALEEAIKRTKSATHEFIRQQYVWFRGHDQGILWHNWENFQSNPLIEHCSNWLEEQDNH